MVISSSPSMIMSHQFTPYLINPHSLLHLGTVRWPEPPAALQEGGIPSIGTNGTGCLKLAKNFGGKYDD